MSIVSKMLWCAVCYRWMAHLVLIVYIEFAWNYVHFNSNDYYFMRFTHLQKSPNYANSLNYLAVSDSWIPVWTCQRSNSQPKGKGLLHGPLLFESLFLTRVGTGWSSTPPKTPHCRTLLHFLKSLLSGVTTKFIIDASHWHLQLSTFANSDHLGELRTNFRKKTWWQSRLAFSTMKINR